VVVRVLRRLACGAKISRYRRDVFNRWHNEFPLEEAGFV
jgi:hypothetical protein